MYFPYLWLLSRFSPWFSAVWYDMPRCTFFFFFFLISCLVFGWASWICGLVSVLKVWKSLALITSNISLLSSHSHYTFVTPLVIVPCYWPIFYWLLHFGHTCTFPLFLRVEREMVVLCPPPSNHLLLFQGLWTTCIHFPIVSNCLGEEFPFSH